MNQAFKVLVVDDEASIRKRVVQLLHKQGYTVAGVNSGESALSLMKNGSFGLVIADIRMPGINGIDLLERIKETDPATEVVMITGYGTVESAVKAIKLGAWDYITKPFDVDKLLKVVENVETKFSLREEVRVLKERLQEFSEVHDFIGISEKIQRVLGIVQKVSPTDCNVLIQGESGTGKSLIARAIHYSSPRNPHPYVVVDCAALSETLLESELFGYVKGAFTGASRDKSGYFKIADRGTIFLDEVSELSPALQGKLLRMAQDHEVIPVGSTKPARINTRIIAASNKDLEMLVKMGKFREDLFFRLNVVKIDIPPLRGRPEDIRPLLYFFLEKFKKRFQKPGLTLADEAVVLLCNYEWPGNVREIENTIQQMVIVADGESIGVKDLGEKIRASAPTKEISRNEAFDPDFQRARKSNLDTFTQHYLTEALRINGGNISRTAKAIQIPRPSLQRMLKRHGISRGRPA